MLDYLLNLINHLVYHTNQGMVHPGLSAGWVLLALGSMLVLAIYLIVFRKNSSHQNYRVITSIANIPHFGPWIQKIITRPQVITLLRIITAAVFLLIIAAGLFGSQVPERNIATTLTWTIWWSGVVISIFFVGSAWCAICPWDAIATWLVKRKLWRRGGELTSLNIRVPKMIRNIWPALMMFVVLSWLELGYGITTSPYETALLALLIVVLATISYAIYERKAFCHYFCPVGRTIGAYSGLSPVALRPIDPQICINCTTLDCYHGTETVEPCPTHLVMGTMKQSTYCTSCGSCTQSCPQQNINWQVRSIGDEITFSSRPHWDESWFILGLLALTLFHGLTMMPYWDNWMSQLAYLIGDKGQLLISFSIGMTIGIIIPILFYSLMILWMKSLINKKIEWRRLFSSMALSVLPLAFSYHIAHNLTHLFRESRGFWEVVANPFGHNTLPLTMHEMHMRHMVPIINENIIFGLQALLIVLGFWMSLKILIHRIQRFNEFNNAQHRFVIVPMLIFISTFSLANLWLLMQPMIMRMM